MQKIKTITIKCQRAKREISLFCKKEKIIKVALKMKQIQTKLIISIAKKQW